jgi:hypothetical protein
MVAPPDAVFAFPFGTDNMGRAGVGQSIGNYLARRKPMPTVIEQALTPFWAGASLFV